MQYNWTITSDENRKALFMDLVRQMDMSYSYKPIQHKAILHKGKIKITDIVTYFKKYNPFKRFEDMNMLRHTKTIGIIEVDSSVWRHLGDDEKKEIETICDRKLDRYFEKILVKDA